MRSQNKSAMRSVLDKLEEVSLFLGILLVPVILSAPTPGV